MLKPFHKLLLAGTSTVVVVGSALFVYGMSAGAMTGEQNLASEARPKIPKAPSVAPELPAPPTLGTPSLKSGAPKEEQKIVVNDPAIGKAWGVGKTDAQKAWEVSLGSKDIVVAIIDTGADVKHEDLAANIWVNTGETGLDAKGRDKRTNGIDDDGDGCIDDVHGCDMITMTGDVVDRHGHGTHIAGIIGAEAGNGKGVAGIAPKVSMMILKYFDPKHPNTNTVKNTVEAIKYAVKHGARIINYSGGGLEYSQEEKDAVAEAEKAGVLFVAAAGNERSNSDVKKYYPADYGLSNIISVTAIDPKTEVLATSNYGTETVDIAAPGQNILSTLPDNGYGYMTGTSQATAFVTGAAVLVMARRPQFSMTEVKKYILSTGDSQSSLMAKTRTARQLNLFKALTMLDSSVSANGVKIANATDEVFGVPARAGAGIGAAAGAGGTTGLGSSTVLGSANALGSFGQQLMKRIDRQAGAAGVN